MRSVIRQTFGHAPSESKAVAYDLLNAAGVVWWHEFLAGLPPPTKREREDEHFPRVARRGFLPEEFHAVVDNYEKYANG